MRHSRYCLFVFLFFVQLSFAQKNMLIGFGASVNSDVTHIVEPYSELINVPLNSTRMSFSYDYFIDSKTIFGADVNFRKLLIGYGLKGSLGYGTASSSLISQVRFNVGRRFNFAGKKLFFEPVVGVSYNGILSGGNLSGGSMIASANQMYQSSYYNYFVNRNFILFHPGISVNLRTNKKFELSLFFNYSFGMVKVYVTNVTYRKNMGDYVNGYVIYNGNSYDLGFKLKYNILTEKKENKN